MYVLNVVAALSVALFSYPLLLLLLLLVFRSRSWLLPLMLYLVYVLLIFHVGCVCVRMYRAGGMLESAGYAHHGELSGCDDPGLYEAAHRRPNIFPVGGARSLRPHERKWRQSGGGYSCHAWP